MCPSVPNTFLIGTFWAYIHCSTQSSVGPACIRFDWPKGPRRNVAKMQNVMRPSRKLWHPVRINKLILLVAAGSLTSSRFENFRQSHVCYDHVELLEFPKNAQSDVLKDLIVIHLNCCLVLQMSWSCCSLLSQGSLQPTYFKRKGKCRKFVLSCNQPNPVNPIQWYFMWLSGIHPTSM